MTPDFHIADHGSLFVLTPVTDAAKAWAEERLPEDAQRWVNGYVIEPRYVSDILDGIIGSDLEIGG